MHARFAGNEVTSPEIAPVEYYHWEWGSSWVHRWVADARFNPRPPWLALCRGWRMMIRGSDSGEKLISEKPWYSRSHEDGSSVGDFQGTSRISSTPPRHSGHCASTGFHQSPSMNQMSPYYSGEWDVIGIYPAGSLFMDPRLRPRRASWVRGEGLHHKDELGKSLLPGSS